MGRALLIFGAAALFAACAGDRPALPAAANAVSAAPAVAADPHTELPCAACHSGALQGARRAAVPRTACTTSGCHEEGGPADVATGTATFHHRDHAQDGEVRLSCAGCHTHDSGTEALRVSVDGCALCHLSDLEGSSPAECRLCHQKPEHVSLTSQALRVPHSALPWIETGCVRCHYDVAEPRTRVPLARCTSCHGRDTALVARGIATDLHPSHTGVTCTACHDGDAHRVRAMSSAVQLICADCHTSEHDVQLGGDAWQDYETCTSCHEAVHQPQQRLLLGLLPNTTVSPSSKFLAGITCRSCHIRTPGALASGDPIRGQAEACAGCHPGEYRQVLDWWLNGTRTRTRTVSAFVTRAESDLGRIPSDSAHELVAGARELIALVEAAGGQHNLELSDRIFRESVARVQQAYTAAGRSSPAPPVLGSPAHEGVCSFCHYASSEPWDFTRMSGPFHRAVLGKER